MSAQGRGIYTFPSAQKAAPAPAAPASGPLAETLELLERSPTATLLRDSTMRKSYEDSPGFFAGLLRALRGEVPALRSQPGIGFDLYFDLCLSRAGSERAVLRYFTKEYGWESLSRRELAVGAARLAARWQNAGAKPGSKLALLANMGPELVIGLLAAYKAGLIPTLVPPTGTVFMRRRLIGTGCKFIGTTSLLHKALSLQPEWSELLLPPITDLGSGPELSSTHLYPDEKPAGALFSLHGDTPDIPIEVPAQKVFLVALRDGILGLRLRDGDHIACAAGEFFQYQPALLLASLLSGATYVHIADEDLARDPRLYATYPLRALVVSAGGAALLARGPRGLLSGVSALHFDAAQGASADGYCKTLAPLGELPPLFAMLYDSAAGGMTMFSGRQKTEGLFSLLPPPGIPFSWKTAIAGPAAPPETGFVKPETQPWSAALLRELPEGYIYLGTVVPRRRGHAFFLADVLEVAQSVPGLDAATVVALPPLPGFIDSRFHLVLFVGASGSPEELTAQVKAAIADKLPASVDPDDIVALPLHARRKSGKVDTEWIRGQYVQGRLQRKAKDILFQRLAVLRELGRMRIAPSEPDAK